LGSAAECILALRPRSRTQETRSCVCIVLLHSVCIGSFTAFMPPAGGAAQEHHTFMYDRHATSGDFCLRQLLETFFEATRVIFNWVLAFYCHRRSSRLYLWTQSISGKYRAHPADRILFLSGSMSSGVISFRLLLMRTLLLLFIWRAEKIIAKCFQCQTRY
jgi:hypothetical protein